METETIGWKAFEEFCSEIELDKHVIEKLEKIFTEELIRKYEAVAKQLTRSETAEQAYESLAEKAEGDRLVELLVYLRAAILSWETVYKPSGISSEIYRASMSVFSRFMQERMTFYDDVNFDRGFWTWRFTAGLEFRIGELEYERTTVEASEEQVGDLAGKSALSIHIPSDATLTRTSLDESYQKAQAFFADYFPDFNYHCVFTDTWLLSPRLKELLKPDSNILTFANDFTVLHFNEKSEDAVEWIWGRKDLPLEDLAEDTSLQRKVKAWLEKEKQVGTAFGVLREF